MKLSDALRKSSKSRSRLVEVAPTANRRLQNRRFRKVPLRTSPSRRRTKKTSGTKLKEIKFRVNIDDHDYLTKIRHGEGFLDKGNKVRVQLQFRGREMGAPEIRDAAHGKSARRSCRMSQVGNGTEDRRAQCHDDAFALAGRAPETAFLGAGQRRRGVARRRNSSDREIAFTRSALLAAVVR